jgi:predicted nucleic-acid-binding Zn-ribbon protein
MKHLLTILSLIALTACVGTLFSAFAVDFPAYESMNECPKCGHDEIADKWHEYSYKCMDEDNLCLGDEHMIRTCKNCGYSLRTLLRSNK